MSTKLIRTFLIIFQIVITATILLADIFGILVSKNSTLSNPLIESMIRSLITLAFTVFYYVSVSDSFVSDSLFFPLYLLFVSVSETRILEMVEEAMLFHFIPTHILVSILILSAFLLGFFIIGYCLLPSSSGRETSLFTMLSFSASMAIAFYGPKSQNISDTWKSKNLLFLLVLLYTIGIIVALIQTAKETASSQKVRYAVGVPLLVNNFVNLVYNTNSMNFVGTVLFIVSFGLIILLVKINSTRL